LERRFDGQTLSTSKKLGRMGKRRSQAKGRIEIAGRVSTVRTMLKDIG